ncbi:MAG: hypothetical protein AAF721_12285 [Myxococcota bacterium]
MRPGAVGCALSLLSGPVMGAPDPVAPASGDSTASVTEPLSSESPDTAALGSQWPASGTIDVANSSMAPCADEANTCQTHLCEEANETCIIALGCRCAELHITPPRPTTPVATKPKPPPAGPHECDDHPQCDDQDVCTADRCVAHVCVYDDISDQCGVSDTCVTRWCDPVTACHSAWSGSTAPECVGGGGGSGALGSGHVVFGASGFGASTCGPGSGLRTDVDDDGVLTLADDEAEERVPGKRLRFDDDFEVLPEVPDYVGTFFELTEAHQQLDGDIATVEVLPCNPATDGYYSITWLSTSLRVFARMGPDWVPTLIQPLYGFDSVSFACTGQAQTLYVQNIGDVTDIYVPSTPFGYDLHTPRDPYLVGLEFKLGASGCADRLLFHDLDVDLQNDSDNDNIVDGVHQLPDRSLEELRAEDVAPGKLVPVNFSGEVLPENLVPVVLNTADLVEPRVQFAYDANAIALYDADLDLIESDVWQDLPASTIEGLSWRETGLYLEGLTQSTEPGDQTLTVLVDEDGDDEPEHFEQVTLTVLNLDYAVWDTDENVEIEVSADEAEIIVYAGAFIDDGVDLSVDDTPTDTVPSRVRFTLTEGDGVLGLVGGPPQGTTLEVDADDYAGVVVHHDRLAGNDLRVEAELVALELAGVMTEGWEALTRSTTLYHVVPGSLSDVSVTATVDAMPHDDGQSEMELTVEVADAWGNPPADGYRIDPSFDASCNPDDGAIELAGGTGTFIVGSGMYPDSTLESRIVVDGESYTLDTEIREVDLQIAGPASVMAGDTAQFVATITDAAGVPLPDGTPVTCLAHRGLLSGKPTASVTLSGGQAVCTVQTDPAAGGDGMVLVSAANTNTARAFEVIAPAGSLTVTAEHDTLVHDASGPGVYAVEEPDGGTDLIPFETATTLTVAGEPDEVVMVSVAASAPLAALPFEHLIAGVSPDLVGDSHGVVEGGWLDDTRARIGAGSIGMAGSGSVTIDSGSATEATETLGASLWLWLDDVDELPLLVKEDDYEVWLNDDETVTLLAMTEDGWASVTTTATVSLEVWHRISIELSATAIAVSLDGSRAALALTAPRVPAAASLVLADGLYGNVDDLVFIDHGAAAAGAAFLSGLGAGGSLQLDDSGFGSFELDVAGTGTDFPALGAETDQFRTVSLNVQSADDGARNATARVRTTEMGIFGRAYYLAKGFIVGAGDGDPVLTHTADITASLIIWGDIRDLIVEASKIWPGGESPNGYVVALALGGLALEFAPGPGEPADVAFAGAKQAIKVMPNGPMRDAMVDMVLDLFKDSKGNPVRFADVALRHWDLFEQIVETAASNPGVLYKLSDKIVNRQQLTAAADFCWRREGALQALGDVTDVPGLDNVAHTVQGVARTFALPMRPGVLDELVDSADALAGVARAADNGIDPVWISEAADLIDALPNPNYSASKFFTAVDDVLDSYPGAELLEVAMRSALSPGAPSRVKQMAYNIEAARHLGAGDELHDFVKVEGSAINKLAPAFKGTIGGELAIWSAVLDPKQALGSGKIKRATQTIEGAMDMAEGMGRVRRIFVPQGQRAQFPQTVHQFIDEIPLTGLE